MADNFGSWLQAKRKAVGLNQTELAERSRLSKTTISMYEANKIAQPRFTQLDKIAKALGLGPDKIRKAFMQFNVNAEEQMLEVEGLRFSPLHAEQYTPEELEELKQTIEVSYGIFKKRIEERKKNAN